MILDTDPIGDARVAAGRSRWSWGDKVQWQDLDGYWRRGEVICFTSERLPIVADWDRREVYQLWPIDLHRVYPRGDDQ